MQSSLLFSDSKKFLDKFKKFITKDVYISHDMVDRFLTEYQYLIDELKKNQYLYQEQNYYQEIFHIYHSSNELVKLHNQKYLKQHISDYSDFFEGLYSIDKLNKNQQMMILSLEDKSLAIVKKNYIPLIVSKIKYMHDYLQCDLDKILVLVEEEEDFKELKKELDVYELEDVSIYYLREYGLSTLRKTDVLLEEGILYQELFRYIINDIYTDKGHFSKFYQLFSDDIYLNRDYLDFDTFRDYHYYMYKRKFLESGLSLKKYNEREIKKRRGQLRTIRNIVVDSREMVDVVNFLELNSIDYQYDRDKCSVICTSKNLHDVITFCDGCGDDVISLDRDGKYLEVLAYELVKRQYGMEKCSDDIIFGILRDTTMDSYFSEFIYQILIPSIYYYQDKGCFDGTLFSEEQGIELKNVYQYYLKYKKKNSYVDQFDLRERVQNKINHSNMSYFIMLGDSQYQFPKNSFVIIKNYPQLNIMKGNLRLLYDYKSYLNHHKCLMVPHLFLGRDEIASYTGMFLKEHLDDLNEQIKNNQKDICVCFYDDKNRFKSFIHLNEKICHAVELEKGKNILFGLQDKNEIKYLLVGDYFTKIGQNILQCNCGSVMCDTLSHVDKKYDVVVLPMLIADSYHQDMFRNDEINQVKIGLFMGLCRSREKLYVMVPISQEDKYKVLFDSISNVTYLDLKEIK